PCAVPRTPTARHRTCQPPLGGGVTSSAAIDAGRGGVRRPGRLHRLRQRWLLQLAGRARCRDGRAPVGFLTDPERESRRPRLHRISQPVHHTRRHDAQALVGVGSKNGVYYTVDRDTGAPVWQQAVVSGGISGGVSPPTGVAFGQVYAPTVTGPPYIFALDDGRRRRVPVPPNRRHGDQLRAPCNSG